MQSEIKIGQRFKFTRSSDNLSQERHAKVTRVLSNREEGMGPEVDYYLAYWVEACELPETATPTTLVFERGVDGNVYLDGHMVTITLLA
jgi:transcriptional regulator with XRE-family HTH domain